MSFGFKVFDSSGNARVFSEGWVFKFFDTYTVTAPAGGSTDVYISGFNPSTWGFQLLELTSSGGAAHEVLFRVSTSQDTITVYGSNFADITATFSVFKG